MYLSTKNISFPKGLVRKLIPKFMGPYKILRDFGNQSFRVDLPAHLKKRGVHDVFHASLMRIHVPNDDRLFPGQLDTQFGALDKQAEGEWAVESILSHSGSGTDSVFEIRWKSGDKTWMPYYQVEHLNALPAYLELVGVEKVLGSPKGSGVPPDDPQIFVSSAELFSQGRAYKGPRKTGPLPIDNHFPFHSTPHYRRSYRSHYPAPHQPSPKPYPARPRPIPLHIPRSHPHPALTARRHRHRRSHLSISSRPTYESVMNHPYVRQKDNSFAIRDPNEETYMLTVHGCQLLSYLEFDRVLRESSKAPNSMSAGYEEFARIFNSASNHDEKFIAIDSEGTTWIESGLRPMNRWASDADFVEVEDMIKFLKKEGLEVLTAKQSAMYNRLVEAETERSLWNRDKRLERLRENKKRGRGADFSKAFDDEGVMKKVWKLAPHGPKVAGRGGKHAEAVKKGKEAEKKGKEPAKEVTDERMEVDMLDEPAGYFDRESGSTPPPNDKTPSGSSAVASGSGSKITAKGKLGGGTRGKPTKD